MRIGRKTFLSVVACCLLLSQQAALLHAISHLEFPGDGRGTRAEVVALAYDQVLSSEFCLECEAFAQVAAVAWGTPMAVSWVPQTAVAIVGQLPTSRDPAVLPPFHARAPPTSL